MSTAPPSLYSLRSHSIFISDAASATGGQDDDWELVNPPHEEVLGGQKLSKVVLRDKDLIVSHGKEIRIMNLGGDSWTVNDGQVGSYKVIKSPHLTFPIHQVILNPTGRLLAVLGHRQVIIIVLPPSGQTGRVGGELECRSFPIDKYQFSKSSNSAISKILWHPWGESGNSLWILTTDGRLREYDVLKPEDPAQTFSFLPSTSASSRFSAVDPLSLHATSFAFSQGAADFGSLSVYVMMANGDLYSMSPIMPLHAEVPVRYLQGLGIHANETGGQAERRWVESLIKQVKASEDLIKQREEDIERLLATPGGRSSRNGDSRRSGEAASRALPSAWEGTVRLHPPHLTEAGGPAVGVHRDLARQGPYTLNPGPPEDDDVEDEPIACELMVIGVPLGEAEDEECINVIAMAWSHGRLDIGLEQESIRPQWVTNRDSPAKSAIIPVVESIHLYTLYSDPLIAPVLSVDTLQKNTLHIRHAYGVDVVSLSSILAGLQEQAHLSFSAVSRLISSDGSPEKLLTGLINFCNITLGYGLLAMATSGQVASVELNFRLAESAPEVSLIAPKDSNNNSGDQQGPNRSLLNEPFDFDTHLKAVTKTTTNHKAVLQTLATRSQPLQTISPDQLRLLGQITLDLQKRSQAVRVANQAIEGRLELQVQEFQKQVDWLKSIKAAMAEVKRTSRSGVDRGEDLLDRQTSLGDRLDGAISLMTSRKRPEATAA